MNNIMMGGLHRGRSWAFYETIGVGLGGKLGKDGTDGIQANMTNTMNTPIEEIERTLPVLVKRYEFRPNSAGLGKYRGGGSGIVRAFMVREGGTVTLTVLAERERHRPWGSWVAFPVRRQRCGWCRTGGRGKATRRQPMSCTRATYSRYAQQGGEGGATEGLRTGSRRKSRETRGLA